MLSTTLATLQDVSFSTPDGRLLFSHLTLIFGQERTALVGRNGVGKTTLLRLLAGSLQPAEGSISRTGVVGYLPQIHTDEQIDCVADALSIGEQWACLGRIMRGEGTSFDFAEADWTLETRLVETLAQVGLSNLAMDQPWKTLSGGQKTRAALAGVLLRQPAFLLLDEPTNNLDAEAQEILLALLKNWQGGAVIVSHDRKLLRNMDRIIELSDLGARSYGGNWDFYHTQKQIEREASLDKLAQVKSEARFIGAMLLVKP
jgi:ATPase subunit of ABC transporter with duplicated ATPase domains